MISSSKKCIGIFYYINVTKYLILVTIVLIIQRHLPRLSKSLRSEMRDKSGRLYMNHHPSTKHSQGPFNFIITSTSVCFQEENQSLDLLLLITTIISHRKRRDGIRNTWAKPLRGNNHSRVRYAFLLGINFEHDITYLLDENKIYGDLIVQNFRETYRNMTLKTLMAIEWSKVYCNNYRFLMKTDDDIFLNVNNILTLVQNYNLANAITGNCYQKAHVVRIREEKSYASFREYPYDSYPGYCSGGGYIMPKSIALDILSISPTVPYFHLEDVYIGICARSLGYKLNSIKGFFFRGKKFKKGQCEIYKSKIMYALLLVNPKDLGHIWANCCQYVKECGSLI